MLPTLPPIVAQFLMPFLRGLSKEQFAKKTNAAVPSILKKMAKDKPREKGGARHAIRYTLYWLCKAVVKSGEAADLWRDHVDDKILAVVEPAITPEMTDEQIVRATLAEFVRLTF